MPANKRTTASKKKSRKRSNTKSEFRVSQINNIRSRYKHGDSMAQLARDNNTSTWHIQRILRTER